MYVATQYRGMGDAASAALLGGGISAGVSLATTAASLWMQSIQLSHQADTATTQIVNGLEPLLRANLDAYKAGPRSCADQAAALAAFDGAMLWLQSPKACGQVGYGSAGNRCISDRLCETGCLFPWIAWYRDPIANDPLASGCAASNAAANPQAGEESAIANLANLTSGSYQQTNPGQFAAAGSSSSSGGGVVSSGGTFDLSSPILGVPMWVWAAGVLVLIVLK